MTTAAITTGMILVPLFDPLSRVSSSANGIYSLMSNINNFTSYKNIVVALKEMDIEASVRILEKLIKELNIKHRTRTLEESLNLLKECIVNIENELSIVHEQMAYNFALKWKWVPFRSYKFNESISKLHMYKRQLDNRTQMLFNIIKTNNDLLTRQNINLAPDVSLFE